MFEKEGSGSWFEKTPEEILGKKHVCECGCDTLVKEKDIMDVWFDSGSSHVGVLNENYGLPEGKADMYLEGNDQYRGWFQSSLLTSVATKGEAPYKEVVTHGMVVDGEGRKMSKSLGNGIAPLDIVNEYGADILRLWATSSDYHSEMRLSKDILKQISEVYKKIRNTVRFLIGNTNDFDPKTDYVEYKDRDELDRYIMYKLNKLVEYINEAYSTYEYHLVYSEIHRFCTTELSSKYLDVIKDRQKVKEILNVSPQETAIAPNLSVRENLEFMAGVYQIKNKEEKIKELISMFKLDDVLNQKAKTLSGGWQRKVSIAMALINDPKILFLDEPTLGLDVIARKELWSVIEKQKNKMTIILTTHYMEEAESLSDRVGIMASGNLIDVGTPEELIKKSGEKNFEDAFVKIATGGEL